METTDDPLATRFLSKVSDATIRVALLALLVVWCFKIVMPFAVPVLWGTVLAIAIAPMHARVRRAMGDRRKLSAALITVLALALLLVPVGLFVGSVVRGASEVSRRMAEGTLTIPPPAPSVAEWPVIGEKVSAAWTLASEDTEAAAQTFAPQIKELAEKLMAAIAGLGMGIAQFAFSIILAGVFIAIGDRTSRPAEAIGERVAGPRGRELVRMSVQTIRSVAQGVVGVALIQALLSGAGMLVVGVPATGLWVLLVLIVAVIQLPPILILGPVAIYVFNTESTVTAVVFLIWAIFVSVSDAFLKPMFLGRGVEVPMLVILIGAIGGMMTSGILGLFLGAVVLAVGYQLFMEWMRAGTDDARSVEPAQPAVGA